MKRSHPYFEEEQRFDQWWLKLIMIAATVVTLGPFYYGSIMQLGSGIPWGDKPMTNTGLIFMDIVITLIMAGVVWLIFGARLITIIKKDGIHIKFKPFYLKERLIKPETIEEFKVREYKPVVDYGGWGIKHGRKGEAINISGKIGLQLWLKNGKKLLIGTRRPEAIKRAMNKMMNSHE